MPQNSSRLTLTESRPGVFAAGLKPRTARASYHKERGIDFSRASRHLYPFMFYTVHVSPNNSTNDF